MRNGWFVALAAAVLLPPAAAHASEKGLVIRAGDIMAQPFIDATKVGPVTANQPVTVLARRGGWVNVESGGKNGWVRALNLRLEGPAGVAPPTAAASGGQRPSFNALSNPSSLLRTNSSGRTVTTGVKGLDEEDIRNATPDPAQLAQLDTLGVADGDARANAEKNKLKESPIEYLKAKTK